VVEKESQAGKSGQLQALEEKQLPVSSHRLPEKPIQVTGFWFPGFNL
jgi:hypothetical protein